MGLFFVFVVIFVVVLVSSQGQRKRTTESWGAVGKALGLRFSPPTMTRKPSLKGAIGQIAVRVRAETRGSGDDRSTYTVYEVRHHSVGPDVELIKQSSLSFFRRFVGGSDIQIGDPFFDEQVIVDAPDPAAVQAFLTPARRAAVLNLFASWPRGRFTNASVRVETRGVERNQQRLHGTITRLVETAQIMGAPADVDRILGGQLEGDLAGTADELHALNEAEPNAFTQMLEAEALVELGRHAEAAQVFDDLDGRLPEDPSVAQWNELAHLPPPPPPPPPPAPPAPVEAGLDAGPDAVAPTQQPADQQAVIDDLFQADRMSWDMVEHFERTYQNSIVEWSGEVIDTSSYLHDTDFGAGPGVKAIVLLGHTGASEFISNEVHAVVQLPEDTELERGTKVAFRGTLHHADRFARKVYVQFGSIS